MKRLILALSFLGLLTSCEQLLFEKDQASIDPQENFDYLWRECDRKYSYFDLKNIDWDAVYTTYSNQIYDDMSQDSLFRVLGNMLNALQDDHTNLISNHNISFFGVHRKGQDNFDWRIITDNYLPKDYFITGPFSHAYLLNKNIAYLRFPSFTGTLVDDDLDYILNKYKDTEGLILDLRENGGGSVSEVFQLLSRFINKETLLNYSRIRNGPSHDDFSEAKPVNLSPYDGVRYSKKVMLLVDRGTYSAGSFTALGTKAIPNITLVGDTTGGGLGLPNGGQLPNGWIFRFSITQALTLDKDESYENGVPPDIAAFVDWNNRNKDEVIEKAIEEIER